MFFAEIGTFCRGLFVLGVGVHCAFPRRGEHVHASYAHSCDVFGIMQETSVMGNPPESLVSCRAEE